MNNKSLKDKLLGLGRTSGDHIIQPPRKTTYRFFFFSIFFLSLSSLNVFFCCQYAQSETLKGIFIRSTGKCTLQHAGCDVFLLSLSRSVGWGRNRKDQHAYTLEIAQGGRPWVLVYMLWLCSNIELLGSNPLLCVHPIQCCAASCEETFWSFVCFCEPGQLRVPGPVCTHWLWGLQLAHHSKVSSFSLHLLPAQLPLQGLQVIPGRSRSGSCAAVPAAQHICTQLKIRSWAEPISRTQSHSRAILVQSGWSDYSLRGVSKLEKLSVSFTQLANKLGACRMWLPGEI